MARAAPSGSSCSCPRWRWPRPTVPIEKRITGYRGPRITVLVADDDEVHRNLIREILAPLGFVVVEAADGTACMGMAESFEPGLILLDIFMPGMSGWEVARALRAKGYAKTAIIMLSANISEAHRALTPERAHDDYLMKPIDLRQLLDKIRALLRLEWISELRSRTVADSGRRTAAGDRPARPLAHPTT